MGPFPYVGSSKLAVNGKELATKPASRFGVQQADTHKAVGDLKRIFADSATVALAAINLPSRGHGAKLMLASSAPRGG